MDGLEAFREVEYVALRVHARSRADARERKREGKTGTSDMFSGLDADFQEIGIDEIVAHQKSLASAKLIEMIEESGLDFSIVWTSLLQTHMLRVTNIKDICVDLAKSGKIANTWGGGSRKPRDTDTIRRAD
jgi:hypothetical protein